MDQDYFASLTISAIDTFGDTQEKSVSHDSARLICFKLGSEEYGISISQAREVIEIIPITPTPHSPDFIMGIINLRSGIYTVIDLGLLLGMPPYGERMDVFENEKRATPRFNGINPAIVILHIEDRIFGVIVDSITAMIKLDDSEVTHPPLMVEGFIQTLVSDLLQIDNRLIMKLDLDKLIEYEPLKALEEGFI